MLDVIKEFHCTHINKGFRNCHPVFEADKMPEHEQLTPCMKSFQCLYAC